MRGSMKHDLCSPAFLSFREKVRRRLAEGERKGVSLLQHSKKKKIEEAMASNQRAPHHPHPEVDTSECMGKV